LIAVSNILAYAIELLSIVRNGLLCTSKMGTAPLSHNDWCYQRHSIGKDSVMMSRWGRTVPGNRDLKLRFDISSVSVRMLNLVKVLVRVGVLMLTTPQHHLT